MKKDGCIFCMIANGEIPSDTIYEDENFRAILDLSPASKGHALLLPKDHCDNLYEMSDETAQKVMPTAKKIATAMKKALKCDGLNLVQNNGEAAGQSVMHFHMHFIPRTEGDGALGLWTPGTSEKEEQAKIAAAIKAEM